MNHNLELYVCAQLCLHGALLMWFGIMKMIELANLQ